MKRWNRHEKLLLVEIIIAIIIPLGSFFLAKNDIPDVALLYQDHTDYHVGRYFTEAKYTNISYEVPILDFEADWMLACSELAMEFDGSASGVQGRCDSSKVILVVPSEFGARSWAAASFGSPVPVRLPVAHVTAFQPKVFPTGIMKVPVAVLPKDLYDELTNRYNTRLRNAFIFGIGLTALILVLLTYALREEEHGKGTAA